MSEKHTPGPWKVRRPTKPKDHEASLNVGVSGVVNGEEEIILEAFGQTSRTGFPAALANAQLCAAAPDLLKVSKRARELYDHLSLGTLEAAVKYGPDYEPPTDYDWLQMRGALEAAIAKAEG